MVNGLSVVSSAVHKRNAAINHSLSLASSGDKINGLIGLCSRFYNLLWYRTQLLGPINGFLIALLFSPVLWFTLYPSKLGFFSWMILGSILRWLRSQVVYSQSFLKKKKKKALACSLDCYSQGASKSPAARCSSLQPPLYRQRAG